MDNHIHGPGCGCQDYAYADESDDLYPNIDTQNIITLNESLKDSGKSIFYELKDKYTK